MATVGGVAVSTVLLVDDQELIRTGFRLILERAGIEVVGEAANGAEAIQLTRSLHPDVVLMDIRMPVLDGIEATRQILDGPEPLPRVLTLTTFDTVSSCTARSSPGRAVLRSRTAARKPWWQRCERWRPARPCSRRG